MGTTFGDQVLVHRKRAGLTQRELAGKLGVDHSYISSIEHGRTLAPPSFDLIVKLSRVLEFEDNELLLLSGRPASATVGQYDLLYGAFKRLAIENWHWLHQQEEGLSFEECTRSSCRYNRHILSACADADVARFEAETKEAEQEHGN